MVCSTINVTGILPPTVTIVDYGFASGSGCVQRCVGILGEPVRIYVVFNANAKAKAKVSIQYDKDAITFFQGWYVAGQVIEAGTSTICFIAPVGYNYIAGNYRNLKVELSEVAPG